MRQGIKRIAASVLALVGIVAMADAGQTKIFDYMYGGDGQRVCLRLPKEKSVRAVLYAHQNMTEEVLFRSPSFTQARRGYGVRAERFAELGHVYRLPGTLRKHHRLAGLDVGP